MQEEQHKIEDLILLYLKNELTAKQEKELNAWMQRNENRELFEELTNQATLKEKLAIYHTIESTQKERGKKLLLDREFPGAHVIEYSHKNRRIVYWVAAAVFVLIAMGGWLLINNYNKKETKQVTAQQSDTKEIAPGGNKAILTLSDNSKIVLDEAQNGSLAQQGNTAITKDGGIVTYKADKAISSSPEILYNKISTPRGGQFHVILPDGSNVWLNAASSIHFPTQFGGKERRVEVTGEVYFEVEKDALHPFRVAIPHNGKQMEIEVLGTHFNVNAYEDEGLISATLLEGSVQVKTDISHTTIKPGQQAQVSNSANKDEKDIHVISDVNTNEAIDWKNGEFVFNKDPLTDILRKVSRWYNVDIVYAGEVPKDKFMGEVERNLNLSQALKILERAGLQFTLEGRKLIVKQQ